MAKLHDPSGKSTVVSSSSWSAPAGDEDEAARFRRPMVRPTASPITRAMSKRRRILSRYQPPRRAMSEGFVHCGGGLPLRDLKRCCCDAGVNSFESGVRYGELGKVYGGGPFGEEGGDDKGDERLRREWRRNERGGIVGGDDRSSDEVDGDASFSLIWGIGRTESNEERWTRFLGGILTAVCEPEGSPPGLVEPPFS